MRAKSLLAFLPSALVTALALAGVFCAATARPEDDTRELRLSASGVRIELLGDSSYRVSLAGQPSSRVLPRSGLLRLRIGTFDPRSAGGPQDPPAPPTLSPRLRALAGRAYIVQFETPPLEAYRADLQRLGARIFQFLPDEAYLVWMEAQARSQVEALPYVRWVGPYEPAYKLEESLRAALETPDQPQAPMRCNVMVLEKGPHMQDVVAARIAALGGRVHAKVRGAFRLEASLTPSQLLRVARLDEVLFIDPWAPPEADMDIAREISGANALETLEGYNGQGVRGEVMDGGVRATHQDFQARPPIIHRGNSADFGHGTSTYGEIFGSGAGSATARGLLPGGQGIFSLNSTADRYVETRELVNPAGTLDAVFQSNSWGSGLTTQYTTVSAEMDHILFDHDILILQSQSNDGTQNSRPQAWAKNILSVGGVRHRNTLSKADDAWQAGASIGPAADGRIKPDLTHFFDSIRTTSSASDTSYTNSFGGTSGATPIVAGYAGLLFQMWADGVFAGGPGQRRDVFASRPHMTTAKALLINSAVQYPFSGTAADLTRVHQGWGMLDLRNLHELARSHDFRLPLLVDESAVIRPLETHTYTVTLQTAAPLKATLVYADPPGSPSAARARVNDLSLKVTSPAGTVFWGNNGLLAGVSSTAGGSSNRVDTVENVFIASADAGTWTVQVLADEIVQDGHVETAALDADYALVVTTPAAIASGATLFFDDFETDRGWQRNAGGTDTATTGLWERADPEPTDSDGPKQLGDAASPSRCLVTGAAAGASAGANDVDGGTTSIQSPPISLSGGSGFTLTFNSYFAHRTNSTADDVLRVRVVGGTSATVFEQRGAATDVDAAWTPHSVSLDAFAGQTVRIVIEAADAATASLVEAGVDDVRVTRP
jgi:hypothetical protein